VPLPAAVGERLPVPLGASDAEAAPDAVAPVAEAFDERDAETVVETERVRETVALDVDERHSVGEADAEVENDGEGDAEVVDVSEAPAPGATRAALSSARSARRRRVMAAWRARAN